MFQECLGFCFLAIYGKRIQWTFNASVGPQLRNGKMMHPELETQSHSLYFLPHATTLMKAVVV